MASPQNTQCESPPLVSRILQAAAQHDILQLKRLLQGNSTAPANVQDPQNGRTPLHACIASCSRACPNPHAISDGSPHRLEGPAITSSEHELEAAAETMRVLLQNGAIWNELDVNLETPGCLARRLNLWGLYEIMVDAGEFIREKRLVRANLIRASGSLYSGVRAEMILSRLEYETDADDREFDEKDRGSSETMDGASAQSEDLEVPSESKSSRLAEMHESQASDNHAYLDTKLQFDGHARIVDNRENLAVMMDWEHEIMKRSVEALCQDVQTPRVLNIGHGLGIIDDLFHTKHPSSHHIVEAHCDLIKRMGESGWLDRPGVTVWKGRWQAQIPLLIAEGLTFDAVYFDTWAEGYQEFKTFFDLHLPALLADNGRFSFFNGMGADYQICYDVYSKIVEMDLLEAGFRLSFATVPVALQSLEETHAWKGLGRPYWTLEEYRLPVVEHLQD